MFDGYGTEIGLDEYALRVCSYVAALPSSHDIDVTPAPLCSWLAETCCSMHEPKVESQRPMIPSESVDHSTAVSPFGRMVSSTKEKLEVD